MNRKPTDDTTDDQILASLFARKLQLSLKVMGRAQALAWHALPMIEKRAYLAKAEQALKQEIKAS